MDNYQKKTRVCPCCRRPVPESYYPRALPTFGGQQQRIFDIVRQNNSVGINCMRIVDLVYAEDPDGGPLGAQKVIHTQIGHINRKLKAVGALARIKGTGGPGSVYHLEYHAQDKGYFKRGAPL